MGYAASTYRQFALSFLTIIFAIGLAISRPFDMVNGLILHWHLVSLQLLVDEFRYAPFVQLIAIAEHDKELQRPCRYGMWCGDADAVADVWQCHCYILHLRG